MNLYEQIQHELDSKSWNYYNMKVGDVLKNTKKSRDFIARYFCEGDKKCKRSIVGIPTSNSRS